MDVTGIRIRLAGAASARRDIDDLTRALDRLGRAGSRAEGGFDDMRDSVLSSRGAFLVALGGAAALLAGMKQLTDAVIQNELAWQRAEAKIRFATGSIPAAADAMRFVREEADRLGLVNLEAADSFGIIAASAKGTRLEGEATRQIFLGMAEASAALSLSGEDTNATLVALGQIMSKGKVQAEELRGQIGERVPGAFQIAARAIGVTAMELDKMLEQGKVMAEDFLPKFAAELRKTFGQDAQANANGLQQEINRLTNAWQDLLRAIGQAGVIEIAADAIQTLAFYAEKAERAILSLTDRFRGLDKMQFAETAAAEAEKIAREMERIQKLMLTFPENSAVYENLGKSLKALQPQYEAAILKSVELSKVTEQQPPLNPPPLPPPPPPAAIKAVKDFAKELQSVVHALDPVAAATDKYKEQITTLNEALDRGKITQEQWTKLTDEAGKNLAKVKAPALAVVDALKQELDLLKLDNRERFIREQILKAGPGLLDAEADSIRDWAGALYDAEAAATVVNDGLLSTGELLDEIAKNSVKRLDDAFADMWRNVIDGTGSAMDVLKRLVLSTLAEIAHAVLTRPIVLQISAALGLGGAAGQAAAGQGGGIGLSNLAGLLNPSSYLSGIGTGLANAGNAIAPYSALGAAPAGTTLSSAGAAGIGGAALGGLGGGLYGYQQGGVRGAALGTGIGVAAGGFAGGALAGAAGGLGGAAAGGLAGAGAALGALGPWGWAALAALAIFGSGKKTPHPFATTIAGGLPGGTINASGDRFASDAQGRDILTGQSGLSFGLDFKHLGQEDAAQFQQALLGIDTALTSLFPTVDLAGKELGRFGVTAEGFVAGLEGDMERMVESGEEVTAKFVRDWLRAGEVMEGAAGDLLQVMEGTAEQLVSATAALKSLEDFSNADLGEEFAAMLAAANTTLFDSYQSQAAALDQLTGDYDGTADATIALANATQLFGQTALSVLAQIEGARNSVGQSADDFVRSIELSLLTADQQYDFLRREADALAEQISRATDPAQIQSLADQWFRSASQAFNLVDEERRGAVGSEFVGTTRDIDRLVNDRLDAVESRVERDVSEQQTLIQQGIENASKMAVAADRIEAAAAAHQAAANSQQSAANTNLSAADGWRAAAATPIRVTVDVANDDAWSRR